VAGSLEQALQGNGQFLLWVIVVVLAIISVLVLILAKNEEQILALERRTNVLGLVRLEYVCSKA